MSGVVESERAIIEHRCRLYETMRRNVVSQVAGATIHETLQPLYAIGNLTAACRNTLRADGEVDKTKILRWLDTIATTVDDAKSLLARLKCYADGSDSAESARTRVCMNALVAEVGQLLTTELEAVGVSLELNLNCDCIADVDVDQIQQVLAELVSNARNAFEQVNSTKESKLGLQCVSISTECVDGHCYVSVQDNGPGVPTESHGEIFKNFFSRDAKRLGLGLGFCKSTITAHGGAIHVKSNESGGFSVHFTIPTTSELPKSEQRHSDHLHC